MNRLVIITLILCLLILTGCGQEQTKSGVDTSMTTELWKGYVNEDQSLAENFNITMECLKLIGIAHDGQPYVVILSGWFKCGDQLTVGCFDHGSGTIYLGNGGYDLVFCHETIHWATGLGKESHGSAYFTQCESAL